MPSNVANKTDNVSTLPASQWNASSGSLLDIIINANGSLIADDRAQFGKAITSAVGAYNFYTDTGSVANTYTLTPITNGSPNNTQRPAPTQYLDGLECRFRTSVVNSGASTVNVASIGVKNITRDGINPLLTNDIKNDRENIVVYSVATDNFILKSLDLSVNIVAPLLVKSTIQLSNNIATPATQLDYSSGYFTSSQSNSIITVSAGTINLLTTGLNGLDAGSLANDTPYYIFAVYNATTDTSGCIASTNNTTPAPPSGFTETRYIGAFHTNGSAEVRGGKWFYSANEYIFKYTDVIIESTDDTFTIAEKTVNLSIPVNVFPLLNIFILAGVVGTNRGQLTYYSQVDKTVFDTALKINGDKSQVNLDLSNLKVDDKILRYTYYIDAITIGANVLNNGWQEIL